MSKRGQTLRLANLKKYGATEYDWSAAIPGLDFLGAALGKMLGTPEVPAKAPAEVTIKTMLAIPRCAGVVDIVRSHACFTNRKANCLEPDNIAYRGYDVDRMNNRVDGVWYGQLLAMGTVVGSGVDFLFLRDYDTNVEDGYFPLNLRPLTWAQPHRAGRGNATVVQGAYVAIEPSMVLHEVCIVPDFVKNAPLKDPSYFLLNDLVHRASDDMLAWQGKGPEEGSEWIWNKKAKASA